MSEPMKILVIDDNEDDRLLYCHALRKSADITYLVSEATDGEEGLKRLQEEIPSCVLLDYSLPGRNGVEVLKRIRAKYPFVPVVMLTGQGNETVAVAAIQQGAQNYISKSSITPESLQRVVQVAIEHCLMQKRIHEQRTSLEIFTRALAHDLKEPVRTICTFLELIDGSDLSSEKSHAYMQHIQQAAERMNTLIDSVYFYTRLDDPAQQIAKETCDVNGIVEDVKQNLSALIQEKKVAITCDPLPHVSANRMQLIQVLQNLIANAIRHCEAAPSIHLCVEEGPIYWLFSVRDNGPGIDEAYRNKVFEPFKRMSRNKEQGLGLGLAICKRIIESHGGKIWYESNPDTGATFLFTLPKMPVTVGTPTALPGAEAGAESPSDSHHIAAGDHHQGGRLANLLLVDDSMADIDLAKIRLIEQTKLQCNLMVARNGEEALAILHEDARQNGSIDLMLLDINMPEMDGFELLESINVDQACQHPAVVMCSGSIYDKDMERAKSLGAKGYLVKPLKFDMLKSLIEHIATLEIRQEDQGYTLLRAA